MSSGSTIALVFRFTPEEARKSQKSISDEYAQLLKTCKGAGLLVAGKRTRSPGTLVVFVDCQNEGRRNALLSWEHALHSPTESLHSAPSPPPDSTATTSNLRALCSYLSAPRTRGGLGIVPHSTGYPHLDAIVVPHDPAFKSKWLSRLRSDVSLGYSDQDVEEISAFYGEPAALYFSFLTHYARALVLPAVIGIGLHFESPAFVQHPLYSILLILWAIVFAEQWRTKYRQLSNILPSADPLSLGEGASAGSPEANPNDRSAWWIVEAKTLVSVPLILGSIGFVCFNMTIAFLLEAFIARLYDGPLKFLAALVPTIYNAATTPPFVAIFSAIANKVTDWEGHYTQRSHDRSLMIKLLPINSIVSFYALILSAGIYIPFGEELMTLFHITLFERQDGEGGEGGWLKAVPEAPATSPKTRLGEQMFSFTLILQLFPLIMEIAVPFVVRFVKAKLAARGQGKTTVVKGEKEDSAEQKLVDAVVYEAGLPTHRFFEDYLTLALQFGYGVMWSTTWPLTPAVLLFLAMIRLRTDALKILVHYQRSPPTRAAADAASIWSEALSALTWAGALINAFLLLVIDPLIQTVSELSSSEAGAPRPHRFDVPALVKRVQSSDTYSLMSPSALRSHLAAVRTPTEKTVSESGLGELAGGVWAPVGTAAVVLLASYGYFGVRWYIRHVFETIGVHHAEKRSVSASAVSSTGAVTSPVQRPTASETFWINDEGEAEIMKKEL